MKERVSEMEHGGIIAANGVILSEILSMKSSDLRLSKTVPASFTELNMLGIGEDFDDCEDSKEINSHEVLETPTHY